MRLNAVLVIALTNPRDITLRSGGIAGESTDGVSEQDSQVQPQNVMAYIRQRPMPCCASTAATSYKIVQWRTRHDSNVWPSPSEGGALSS